MSPVPRKETEIHFTADENIIPLMKDVTKFINAIAKPQLPGMYNPWSYCNATPDIKADFATFLTQFGDVQNSKIVTQIVINFTAGQYATGDVTGHNHDTNSHAAGIPVGYTDASTAVPASAGFGVPDFGLTLGTDASPTSATLTLTMDHRDTPGQDGEHWVGKNITPTVELTMEIEGIPTSQTAAAIESDLTGWTVDSFGPSDGNQAFDTYALSAHRYFDLVTA